MKKKALITGITGQDGSYLAELLLSKGYEVHGIIRRSSSFNTSRISSILENENLKTYYGDVTDTSNLNRILEKVEPDEIYNLAAQSHVKISFEIPEYTSSVDALGTLRFLDAIKTTGVKQNFIKHPQVSYMVKSYKPLRVKILLLILAHLMELPNYMLIGR